MEKNSLTQLSAPQIQALFAQQMAQNDVLMKDNSQLVKHNAKLTDKITELEQKVAFFERELFGRKSEKRLLDNPQQSELFTQDKPVQEAAVETTVQAHQRKSSTKRSGNEVNDTGLRFDESVPQTIIEVPAPELCDDDEIIGYKETHRLAQRPSSYEILTYRRPVIKSKQSQSLITTEAPSNVLEGCYCDVSLLAGMMTDKALYHLPLHRQHQRMLASGIHLSRATLTNWVQQAISLLKPIYQAQLAHILESQVLAMDETPMKAGRKVKGKMHQSYFWPLYGEADEVAFTWSATRSSKHATEQLTGFQGVLLTDGYKAYETTVKALNKQDEQLIHASCWVHARRYFERALTVETQESEQALTWIAKLYQQEKIIREKSLPPDKIRERRREKSEPIVDQFFRWVYQQRQRAELLPSNPLRKALEYVAHREIALKVFLSNPQVPMDTNHLERALRCIAMGRKNHLFCWTELGAEQLGMLQSLVVTCRLQGINPYHYLVDVLQRIATHPNRDILELTPRLWKDKFKGNFLTSDLA